ncbi:MAG: SDR family oxidoreductase [Candidatus Omnitrophica bacterium]|nr:SDR family oxidoreductase [Candidatus Omnitrophota bacterium]
MSTAVITGASSGIGYEFAKILAEKQYQLVLIARNLDRLNEIKQELETRHDTSIILIPADLALDNIAEGIIKEIRYRNLKVEILINNAGFGYCGPYPQQPWQNERDMLHVNVQSLAQLTRLILPLMFERKKGYICNVASTAAFYPGPLMAVYYATKAYVVSYSQALRNELKDSGVAVSVLCPGPTATNFQTIAGVDQTRLFKMSRLATAREVAEYGFRAMLRNQAVAIPGLSNKLLYFTSRFLLRDMVTAMVRWIQSVKTGSRKKHG